MACVSVVIPTKNRRSSLERLLASLRRQTLTDVEIIVVDDGSTEPVGHIPGVRTLRHEQSRGACASRNAGFRASTAEYIAYFDDDAEAHDPGLLERAIAWPRARPKCHAVGFRQVDAHDRTRGVNPANVDHPALVKCFFTYGCLVSRQSLLETNGFREPFGYYCEEAELSLRLLDAAFEIVYDPSLRVIHHEDVRERNWRKISHLSLRNSLLTVLLDYPAPLVLPGMLRAVTNNFRAFRGSVGVDLKGKLAAIGATVDQLGYVRCERSPVSYGALRGQISLGRQPRAIERPRATELT